MSELKIAELVLEYLQALAWPGVAVFFGILFRGQIAGLFSRVEEASAFGASLKLEKRAEQVEKALISSTDQTEEVERSTKDRPANALGGDSEGFLLAMETTSFLRAWKELEEVANRAASKLGISDRGSTSPRFVAERLATRGWISRETAESIKQLTAARNDIVHSQVEVAPTTARSLVRSVEQATSILRVALNHN